MENNNTGSRVGTTTAVRNVKGLAYLEPLCLDMQSNLLKDF